MEFNLKKEINKRAVLFEILAKMLIRKQNNNNFIFRTHDFYTFDEIIKKYRLNLKLIKKEKINLIKNYLSTTDLVEFKLNSTKERIVYDIIIYEVKTKNNTNLFNHDMCLSSYQTYFNAQKLGITTILVSFILNDNWNFSFEIKNLKLNEMSIYSRQMKDKNEAIKRAKELKLIKEI